jgi:hypothetical protein
MESIQVQPPQQKYLFQNLKKHPSKSIIRTLNSKIIFKAIREKPFSHLEPQNNFA